MTTDERLDRAHALDGLLGMVADAMRTEVLLVDPDTPADVAARRLEREGISGAPVVRHGHVVGVVTLRDLFAAAGHHEAAQTTGPFLRHEAELAGYRVDELMTHRPTTVLSTWPLTRAVTLMVDQGVNRLPVVDWDAHVVGILTRDDILRAVAAAAGRRVHQDRYPRLLPD
jgi:CBS domain-containing protein